MKTRQVPLKKIVSLIKRGITPKYVDDGICVLNQKCIRDGRISLEPARLTSKNSRISVEQFLQNGDVLVNSTGTGTLGRTAPFHYSNGLEQAVVDTHVTIVRPETGTVNARYLAYVLRQCEPSITHMAKGATNQVELSARDLSFLPIKLRDKREQDRIASILSAYDDLIENNRRRIQLLEESARLLYTEWFVRLHFPGHEHVKIIDGVPEGWEKKKIAEVSDTYGGGTPSTKVSEYWVGGNITWFIPKDLTNNDCLVLLDSEKKITEEGLKKSSAKMLPPETILMTSRASIGYFGLYDGAACTNQGFISIVPKKDFLKLYLLHNLMGRKEEILSRSGGTTYKEINKTTFRNMSLVTPPDHLLKQFDSFAYDVVKQARILKKQEAALKQARDLLLPRLMNGEIEV